MTEATINVLHVVGGTEFRGGTADVVACLAALSLPGISQAVWLAAEATTEGIKFPAVRAGRARAVNASVRHDALAGWREAGVLAEWLKSQPRTILHAHTRVGLVAAALAGPRAQVPVIFHQHFLPRRRLVYRWLRSRCGARVIYNSAKTCRHFGEDPATAFILSPTIDWPEAPSAARSGPLRFVAAGAFVPGKHLDILLAAFRQFQPANPDAELHLHGVAEAPLDAAYQRHIVEIGRAEPGVRLHPWSANWAGSVAPQDVFVHLGQPESFGVVLLEAFARGCRMVVLPETFLDELPVPHSQAGLTRAGRLVPAAVAAAMREAGAMVAPPTGFWETRRAVRGLFRMEQHTDRLAQWYRELAGIPLT